MGATSQGKTTHYYVPAQSIWPIATAVALFITAIGGASFIQQSTDFVANEGSLGSTIFAIGMIAVSYTHLTLPTTPYV